MSNTIFDPPFPLDALSPTLIGAAEFIRLTNQSPIEMCACSVLAAASLVCHGLVNVHWREHALSPVSLIVFVEAESGERKTANDNIAFREIRRFTAEQVAHARSEEKAHEIELRVWDLKVKEAEKSLVRSTAEGANTEELEVQWKKLLESKPKKRMRAQMLLSNVTRQALARHLATVYPYVGLISDEGAVVTDSDALGDVGMLNKLSDGGTWSSDRVTRERVELEGVRLMVYLQIQPGILDNFLRGRGKQALSSGFASRWLYAHAKSLQGTRVHRFVDIPEELIQRYHARTTALLKAYEGPAVPKPEGYRLGKAAAELLAWFAEKVEIELAEGGRFCLMKGHAAKAAERCAMLSALMHKFEGYEGPIALEVMKGAVRLVAWHLNQYRMRFCPLSQPELDALDLEECITRHAHKYAKTRSIPGPELCRLAPRRLRQVDSVWETVAMLESQGKVKIWGRKGEAWHVHLQYWFPTHIAPPPEPRELPSGRFSRWIVDPHLPPAASADPPQEEGHVLWPGVVLP